MLKDLNLEEKEILRKFHKEKSIEKRRYYNKKHRTKFPEKEKCKQKTKYLIRIGKIKRKPCIYCDDENSEVHHFDYNNPYNIVWVCHKHHIKIYHTGSVKNT